MPTFRGVNHVSLSVTDLDRSEDFYTRVLDFIRLLDFGDGRVLVHPATSFMIGLTRHPEGSGEAFSELNTGLDHVGLGAESRAELEEWARRFDEADVSYTPIRDMEFGYHLNFRDPDNIALEFHAPNEIAVAGFADLRDRDVSREEIDARIRSVLDPPS